MRGRLEAVSAQPGSETEARHGAGIGEGRNRRLLTEIDDKIAFLYRSDGVMRGCVVLSTRKPRPTPTVHPSSPRSGEEEQKKKKKKKKMVTEGLVRSTRTQALQPWELRLISAEWRTILALKSRGVLGENAFSVRISAKERFSSHRTIIPSPPSARPNKRTSPRKKASAQSLSVSGIVFQESRALVPVSSRVSGAKRDTTSP